MFATSHLDGMQTITLAAVALMMLGVGGLMLLSLIRRRQEEG